jgi:hypothetical protein
LEHSHPHRIFLLSPANAGGLRAQLMLNDRAQFDLAVRLRGDGVALGEVFAFISGLYFRGKLTYAQAFAAPPPGLPGTLVITAGLGLLAPDTAVTIDHLRQIASVPVDAADERYRKPLARDARTLADYAGSSCAVVLLGSIATAKYVEPLLEVFGDRLLFPAEFVGRGDMSRGGLMLRSARSGSELTYVPVAGAIRHGPRPARLPRIKRG